jgi:hypothetical protein
MAWIEVHQSLRNHPKTKKLARLLGITVAHAAGLVVLLWLYCLDYAQKGDLSTLDEDEIAEAAGWEGDAQQFVQALLNCGRQGEAGFLEYVEPGDEGVVADLVVHDWDDYAGLLLERREANAKRMREKRAKAREENESPKQNARAAQTSQPSQQRATNVQRTTNARVGLPNPTEQYHDRTLPKGDRAGAREKPPTPSEKTSSECQTEIASSPTGTGKAEAEGETGPVGGNVAPRPGFISAGTWALGPDELAVLSPLATGLAVEPRDIPGRIGTAIAKRCSYGKNENRVYDAWFALKPDVVVAWVAEAFKRAKAARVEDGGLINYAAAIVADTLQVNGNLLDLPKAAANVVTHPAARTRPTKRSVGEVGGSWLEKRREAGL